MSAQRLLIFNLKVLVTTAAVCGILAFTGCESDGGGTSDPGSGSGEYTKPLGTEASPYRLSMTKGTADPYDIEPDRIEPTDVENGTGDSFTFNTAIFENPSKLPDNSWYTATGALDGEGKVKDKIWLRKNFIGLKGTFNNVQLTAPYINGGDLTFDVPCKEEEIENGVVISKSKPKAPLDKIQVFEAGLVTSGTMRVGPNYAKERVTSGAATYMN